MSRRARHRFRAALGGFARAQEGVAAIEFGMLALPFFSLLYAMLELGLIFFAGNYLETAVQNAARRVRTGEIRTAEAFRDSLCTGDKREVRFLITCDAKLVTTVANLGSFGGAAPAAGSTYTATGNQVVLVRAEYAYPVIGPVVVGKTWGRTLVATSVLCTEPFDNPTTNGC